MGVKNRHSSPSSSSKEVLQRGPTLLGANRKTESEERKRKVGVPGGQQCSWESHPRVYRRRSKT